MTSKPGGAVQSFELNAKSFLDLRVQSPERFDRYIRPTLRDLGAENIALVPPETMVQLFPDAWKVSSGARTLFEKNLPLLDADDWATRERAQQAIVGLGTEALILTMKVDTRKLSLEAQSRIDEVKRRFTRLDAHECEVLRGSTLVLLECLTCDHDAVRGAANQFIEEHVGHSIDFNAMASSEIRAAQIKLLSEELVDIGREPPPNGARLSAHANLTEAPRRFPKS